MKKLLKITLTLFITLIIVLGFAVPVNMVGNWYQQFMPNVNGEPISDIFFLDSLTGWAVTGDDLPNDSNYILKTTNGGDTWQKMYSAFKDFYKVKFINQNTGFVCAGFNVSGECILKSTNAGNNWSLINSPFRIYTNDMFVLNQDTIWLVEKESTEGGVFLTTNGGTNWSVQFTSFGNNPDKIYMYNRNFGFISHNNASMYRTTNGGTSWVLVTGLDGFRGIYFSDSLTGWKANGMIKKTTDGGLNWIAQATPFGGILVNSGALRLSGLSKDTIFGVGSYVQYPNLQSRGVIYRTVNGGVNWLFQIPDTGITSNTNYSFIQFLNPRIGWAYTLTTGAHTTNGGDVTWLTPVEQISVEIPGEYKLFQNYPNPFNPVTNIKYQIINNSSNVKLVIFDLTGREIVRLVNEEQTTGTYVVVFDGSKYSSGVYFYKLIVLSALGGGKEVFTQTRRMLLVK